MNRILKDKLNINIINMIELYLLPLKNKNDKVFVHLKNRTRILYYRLNSNECFNFTTKIYENNLTNAKIIKVETITLFWTLGKN